MAGLFLVDIEDILKSCRPLVFNTDSLECPLDGNTTASMPRLCVQQH